MKLGAFYKPTYGQHIVICLFCPDSIYAEITFDVHGKWIGIGVHTELLRGNSCYLENTWLSALNSGVRLCIFLRFPGLD